jgi:hypothetical protein
MTREHSKRTRGGATAPGTWLALAALASLVAACGNKCKALCEDTKACKQPSAPAESSDCAEQCDANQSHADSAGCSAQWDDYLDCQDDIDDICNPPPSACSRERDKLDTCAMQYCAAHPGDALCSS